MDMPRSGIVGRGIVNNCSPSCSGQRERKIARARGYCRTFGRDRLWGSVFVLVVLGGKDGERVPLWIEKS